MFGKKIRWNRFVNPESGMGLLVPIDHGLTMGPLEGLQNFTEIGRWIRHRAITGLIAHKGMVTRIGGRKLLPRGGVMIHLNGMTSLASSPDRKILFTSVEAAMRLGADAVSIQINFDGRNDEHNLMLLGSVADQAQAFGVPVLTMLYDKVGQPSAAARLRRLRHLIRAAVELGTDALKLAAPADHSEIPVLLDGIKDHTPVFFAGGALCSEDEMLTLAKSVVANGAAGLCVGRNVFQRPDARDVLDRIGGVLHQWPERYYQAVATPAVLPAQV